MVGMLAGVLAFLAMSGAVVIGAQILYDPERGYHLVGTPRGNRALETTARSVQPTGRGTITAETEMIEGNYRSNCSSKTAKASASSACLQATDGRHNQAPVNRASFPRALALPWHREMTR